MHREQRSSSLPVLRLRMRKVVEGFFYFCAAGGEIPRFSQLETCEVFAADRCCQQPPSLLIPIWLLVPSPAAASEVSGAMPPSLLAALCSARPGSALAIYPKEHQGAASFPCSPPLLADSNASLPDSALCRIPHSFCGSTVQLLVWQRQPRSCPAPSCSSSPGCKPDELMFCMSPAARRDVSGAEVVLKYWFSSCSGLHQPAGWDEAALPLQFSSHSKSWALPYPDLVQKGNRGIRSALDNATIPARSLVIRYVMELAENKIFGQFVHVEIFI